MPPIRVAAMHGRLLTINIKIANMNKKTIFVMLLVAAAVVVAIFLMGRWLDRRTPDLIQGTVECTTYKASSKIAGRIEEMKVRQGQTVQKGELLYILSTPELDAKLQQAEAVRSAAAAMDEKALTGARIQQVEAALNMWQKAQAGKELAQKTYERVERLYKQGVVPAQKFDEAAANYSAAVATEAAAKAQYDLVKDGASREDKKAAAAQVRQAQGAVNEVESYIGDAMVYAPVTGEVATIIAEQGELVGSGYPVVAILDRSDMWVTFNVKESMLPHIDIGTRMTGYVPALGRDVELAVSYIAVEADFATWAATRTQGGFDVRTFAVKARPVEGEPQLRPGMSVLVDWSEIE